MGLKVDPQELRAVGFIRVFGFRASGLQGFRASGLRASGLQGFRASGLQGLGFRV